MHAACSGTTMEVTWNYNLCSSSLFVLHCSSSPNIRNIHNLHVLFGWCAPFGLVWKPSAEPDTTDGWQILSAISSALFLIPSTDCELHRKQSYNWSVAKPCIYCSPFIWEHVCMSVEYFFLITRLKVVK